ncbi:hypothetical protein B0H14DRAFT_2825488 [Mycena olivaceomarginata]|nr:hypothetical protein B0H14DRAFT_2825488 [Mycena olivaceomarginata]
MDSAVSFNVNTTIGIFQIGVLISYVLFGVTTTQSYIYYSRFPEDSSNLKALVAFVWICELGHAICMGHALYIYTILDYAHPERLLGAFPISGSISPFFVGLIVACVQGFFSFRIYALSKRLYIPILSWTMSLMRLAAHTVMGVEAVRMTSWASYEAQWRPLLTAIWIVSAANDVLITTTLVYLLYRQRSHVHKRTVAVMDKIILWTVETGMLTSVSGIMMICFLTMENFVWLAFYAVEARVFSNSLLARQVHCGEEQWIHADYDTYPA